MRSDDVDIALHILNREEVARYVEMCTTVSKCRLVSNKAIRNFAIVGYDNLAERLQAVVDTSLRATNDDNTILVDCHLVALSRHKDVCAHLDTLATLYGVHKDDIDVELNGHSARLFASQGQQRSLALALKIAEGEICREDCGEYPVFLFDDVLSELDSRRRAYLLEQMSGKQVILTSCEQIADFKGKKMYVENGTVREI